jgi:arylsulfatase
MLPLLDKLGGPESFPHYPVGWALAMDTPYLWTKQVSGGAIRSRWHHVIDVVPTLLEAASLPAPYSVDGVAQKPLEGVSMCYSFDDSSASDRHTTQYFEMPWVTDAKVSFADDRWELYDTNRDWTQADDLSAEHPEKLRELQEQFLIEAAKYQVFPLDDRTIERFIPALAGRPDLMGNRTSMTFSRVCVSYRRTPYRTSKTGRTRSPPRSMRRRIAAQPA